MVKVECVLEAKNILGEGRVPAPVDGQLYWVDMLGKEIWSLGPKSGGAMTRALVGERVEIAGRCALCLDGAIEIGP